MGCLSFSFTFLLTSVHSSGGKCLQVYIAADEDGQDCIHTFYKCRESIQKLTKLFCNLFDSDILTFPAGFVQLRRLIDSFFF